MKTILSLAFAVSMLALSTPAFALSLNDFIRPWVSTDDPNVPNCTVLSHPDGCENILRMAGTVTSHGTASCPCPWETFTDEHCVK